MIYGDLLYTVIGIGLGALAFWMAIFAEKNKNTSFKLIYVLPMIWSVFMIMFGAFEKSLIMHIGLHRKLNFRIVNQVVIYLER